MIATPAPSRARRTGLVVGTAVFGACALLAVAAGPALAEAPAGQPVGTPAQLAWVARGDAPAVTPAIAAKLGPDDGEARFETLPRLPGETLQPRQAALPASQRSDARGVANASKPAL